MKTVSGSWSWTQVINILFITLWLAVQVAGPFGFNEFQPPAWAVAAVPILVALINLLIRYFRTKEPIAR